MQQKQYFVYLYFDKFGTVIYVGLTERPLANRVREHKAEALQMETDHVEYAVVPTKTDMRMYELYYINKYQPKYNTADMFLQEARTDVPELTFVPYLEHGAEQHVATSADARTYTLLCENGKIIATVHHPYSKHAGPVSVSVCGSPELNKDSLRQFVEQMEEIENDIA